MSTNDESVLFVSIKKVIDGRESLIVLGGEELCSLSLNKSNTSMMFRM